MPRWSTLVTRLLGLLVAGSLPLGHVGCQSPHARALDSAATHVDAGTDSADTLVDSAAEPADASIAPTDTSTDTSTGLVDATIDVTASIDSSVSCDDEEASGLPLAQPARSGQIPPRRWLLGPWYGTLCGWTYGSPTIACAPGIVSAGEQAMASLAGFSQHDIPITALHFDGNGWSKWQSNQVSANECAPALDPSVVDQMAALNVKALLHYWGYCVDAEGFDRANQAMGGTLGGFYLDDGAGALVSSNVLDWVAEALPGDGAFVSKRYPYPSSWTPWGAGFGGIPDDWNREHAHSAYVNDLPHDWEGMAEGIRRVFDSSSILPAPFNEFLGFQSFPDPGEQPPTLAQYYRRLHFGAMQVVMDNSPYENLDPWRPEWDPRLLSAYRYYAWLHLELVPYLHSYDREAYEYGTAIFRSPDRDRFSTMLGDELFVNYVVGDDIAQLPVWFPPGEWLDYWDLSRSYVGPGEFRVPVGPVPPAPDSNLVTGREPIFIRRGAIIPMDVRRDYTGHGTRESEGSLTVLIFPAESSSFRYFDDTASRWVTLGASLDGDRLTLTKSRRLSQPQLYRIEGWQAPPRSVSLCGRSILVNGDTQPGLDAGASEAAVNGSPRSTWFYDALAKRLIVKVF